jgi:hypothetical protein
MAVLYKRIALKILISLLVCLGVVPFAWAQEKFPLALAIDDEPGYASGDVVLRVARPAGIYFKEGQIFICKGLYKTDDADTITKGSGFITAVNIDHLECKMKEKDIRIKPAKDDLCFFIIEGLDKRKDVFFKLARFAISFTSVTDTILFDAPNSLHGWNDDKTADLLKKMVADIHYTGEAMLKQNDKQQQTISTGDFRGKLLFSAMQQINENSVLDFLKYVWARPVKYAGHSWRISEVFATWMNGGTPKMAEEIQ